MPKKKNKEKFDLITTACTQLDSPETIKNLFGKDFQPQRVKSQTQKPLV